jgi:hypothetical protein
MEPVQPVGDLMLFVGYTCDAGMCRNSVMQSKQQWHNVHSQDQSTAQQHGTVQVHMQDIQNKYNSLQIVIN